MSTTLENSSTQTLSKPAFDFASAVDRMGSREAFHEIAELFLSIAPDFMAQMRDAQIRGNCYDLERTAHVLKGSAAVLSAHDVVRTTELLESMGRNHRLAGGETMIGELERELSELISAIQESMGIYDNISQ